MVDPFIPSLRASLAAMGQVPHTLMLVEPHKVDEYQRIADQRGIAGQLRIEGSELAPEGKAILIELCLHSGEPAATCICKYHLTQRLGPPRLFPGAL